MAGARRCPPSVHLGNQVSACVLILLVVTICNISDVASQKRWSRALDSPYGKYLKYCRDNWLAISQREDPKEVAKCFHELGISIAPLATNPNGIPALGVPRFDPYEHPEPLTIGRKGEAFQVVFTKSVIAGTGSVLTEKDTVGRYDPVKREFTLTATLPSAMDISSDYDAILDLSHFFGGGGGEPVKTAGTFIGKVGNVSAIITTTLDKNKKGELVVRSARAQVEVSNYKDLVIKGKDPNDPLPNAFSRIFSEELAAPFVELIQPTMRRVLARFIGQVYRKGLKHLDEI